MAPSQFSPLASFLVIFFCVTNSINAQLNPDFYDELCPKALPTIRMVVEEAVAGEPRMGASLLRLHFHDCFVNGCDGSILLDDTPTFVGEKTAGPNVNSARGFDVIDSIKDAVNSACHGNLVSCADILAVAARDSVVALGGRSYAVQVGRRDSMTASRDAANNDIPAPSLSFQGLTSNFQSHGLSIKDLVVLSGGHTIGQAQCTNFRARIHNETDIDGNFASSLQSQCPRSGGDNNLSPLDATPRSFDSAYFGDLVQRKGLLHSDQQLYRGDGSESDGHVKRYSEDLEGFWEDFGVSMIKMGNMSPLTGDSGEIRKDCRKPN